jgi:hypothetical protein
MYQLPSLSEQFAAAFSALIPFLLAVGFVGVGVWKFIQYLYRWRYDGQGNWGNAGLCPGSSPHKCP